MSVYRAMRARREHLDRADCPLTLMARSLWADLAGRVDYDGACWPDVATLRVGLGGVDRGTVQRATAQLVAYGVLDVIVARGRGRRNTYRLELAREENAAPARPIDQETPRQRGLSPVVANLENAALGAENAALAPPHIGEVVKRSRREPSPRTIEETPHQRGVSEDVETAAWAADIIARHYAGQVRTRRRQVS